MDFYLTPEGFYCSEKMAKNLTTYYELIGWEEAPRLYWMTGKNHHKKWMPHGFIRATKKDREIIRITIKTFR